MDDFDFLREMVHRKGKCIILHLSNRKSVQGVVESGPATTQRDASLLSIGAISPVGAVGFDGSASIGVAVACGVRFGS